MGNDVFDSVFGGNAEDKRSESPFDLLDEVTDKFFETMAISNSEEGDEPMFTHIIW